MRISNLLLLPTEPFLEVNERRSSSKGRETKFGTCECCPVNKIIDEDIKKKLVTNYYLGTELNDKANINKIECCPVNTNN